MKSACLVVLAGCWSSAATTTPAPLPTPSARYQPTCSDAAIGIERGTRDLRAPDHLIAKAMREQCVSGPWPTAAIACFAAMKPDELGRCVGALAQPQRDAIFEELRGTDRASVAIALVKLSGLHIGIAECDQFIATVSLVLGCDAMPIDDRVQLGVETADAWSLPAKLPANMQQRMATACRHSLDDLKTRASALHCL